MQLTKEEIREWLKMGKVNNATHVVVVCDTFSYEDYPVYVMKKENIQEVIEKYSGKNMQTIMEVYNLSLDFESQLLEDRAYHL